MKPFAQPLFMVISAAITLIYTSPGLAQRGDPPESFVTIYSYDASETGPDTTPTLTGDLVFESSFDGASFYRPAEEGATGSLLYSFIAPDAQFDDFVVLSTFSIAGFDGSFGRITGSRAIDGGSFVPFQTLDVEPGEVNQTVTSSTRFPVDGSLVQIRFDVESTQGDPLGVQLFRDDSSQPIPFQVMATFVPEPSILAIGCGMCCTLLLRRRTGLNTGCS